MKVAIAIAAQTGIEIGVGHDVPTARSAAVPTKVAAAGVSRAAVAVPVLHCEVVHRVVVAVARAAFGAALPEAAVALVAKQLFHAASALVPLQAPPVAVSASPSAVVAVAVAAGPDKAEGKEVWEVNCRAPTS